MRKGIAAIAAFLLVLLFALTACAGTPGDSPPEVISAGATATTAPGSAADVISRLGYCYTIGEKGPETLFCEYTDDNTWRVVFWEKYNEDIDGPLILVGTENYTRLYLQELSAEYPSSCAIYENRDNPSWCEVYDQEYGPGS